MKFTKWLPIYFVAVVFFTSLQSENPNFNNPQVIKQQTEDAIAFVAMVNPWRDAIEKYSEKNNINLEIKCKGCGKRVLTLGAFDGCLLAWIIKAIADGHEAFEKVKALVEEYIKLLSNSASTDELINFMLKVSNDMKQVCTGCHGVEWDRSA